MLPGLDNFKFLKYKLLDPLWYDYGVKVKIGLKSRLAKLMLSIGLKDP